MIPVAESGSLTAVPPGGVAAWLAGEQAPTPADVASALRVGSDCTRPTAQAKAVLSQVLSAPIRPIPVAVLEGLVIETAGEFVKRLASPAGSAQGVDTTSGMPVRAARDPLAANWPTIRRYIGQAIG